MLGACSRRAILRVVRNGGAMLGSVGQVGVGFGILLSWAVVAAVIAVVALPFVVRAVPAVRRASLVARSPRRAAEATVVNRRTELAPSQDGSGTQQHFVTFQFPDGERVELGVAGGESGMLTVGDQGTLDWQGPRFHGFTREILR